MADKIKEFLKNFFELVFFLGGIALIFATPVGLVWGCLEWSQRADHNNLVQDIRHNRFATITCQSNGTEVEYQAYQYTVSVYTGIVQYSFYDKDQNRITIINDNCIVFDPRK